MIPGASLDRACAVPDGRGVEPDVRVEPTPGWFVGREDPQLDAAIARSRAGR